ncbi:hypothetical protein BDN72DRAFT_222182 [Pluteus cervinus]|uniref:Uncharacterized protein n=1 Tax=Pluteus cervinus TaxID=181527 RepID=A0ACD3AI04_9AGAR|nr:hypothetical protein BDN72DRAFT_222182 [Pluteus cervinus]
MKALILRGSCVAFFPARPPFALYLHVATNSSCHQLVHVPSGAYTVSLVPLVVLQAPPAPLLVACYNYIASAWSQFRTE